MVAVIPAGGVDTDRFTLPVNPLPPTTNIVYVLVAEDPMFRDAGSGYSVKPCGDTTVNGRARSRGRL
jgi:hypothetical protein